MLLPDGRIGLIDFGATKRLTQKERLSVCLLYAALGRKDEQMLFDMCDIGGYRSKHGDKQVLMKLLLFGYDSWGRDVLEGKNIQTFIDELKRKDPWEEVPDNLVMAQVSARGWNHQKGVFRGQAELCVRHCGAFRSECCSDLSHYVLSLAHVSRLCLSALTNASS